MYDCWIYAAYLPATCSQGLTGLCPLDFKNNYLINGDRKMYSPNTQHDRVQDAQTFLTKLSSSGTDTYKENRQTKGEAEKTNKMTDTYKESGN